MPDSNQTNNRAEEIRRRRARRSRGKTARSTSKSGKKYNATSKPPVMMRDGGSRVSTQSRRKGVRPKRRYDVALSTPGAEMRLPSLPVVHFGWRLISGLMVGMLVFTLYTIWNSPMYQVTAAQVEGIHRLTSQDINLVANVAGQPIFTLYPEQIERDLQLAFLEIESISVDVQLPATVLLSVVERQPVLVWEEDGRTTWIDSKGVAFPPRGEESPSVKVIAEQVLPSRSSGLDEEEKVDSPGRYLPPQLVSAILTLSVQVPEDTPLIYTNDRGLGWDDPRGWKVYFGMNTDDMEMKLRVYKALVKKLKKEDVRPELISVEYVHAPYYRMEP